MTHLKVLPLQDKGDHILCEYEVQKTFIEAAAKRSIKADDPQLELKRSLAAMYCFDPRITPEDIIDFTIHEGSIEDRFLIHLRLKKKCTTPSSPQT